MSKLFQIILNPVDFSPPSDAAHLLARSLAQAHGARLIALHVNEPLVLPVDFSFGPPTQFEIEDRLRDHAQAKLAALQAAAPEIALETAMRKGNPSQEILAAAKELRADLIVMGTHGRTGFSHVVMGSTAERVARTAPCSVLTVHARPAGRHPTA